MGTKMAARSILASAVFGLFVALTSAQAASIFSQAPCAPFPGPCVGFDADDPIPVIRKFSFNAPGPGTAQVTFHGTADCGIVASNVDEGLDLVSQIVTQASAPASLTGPGGLRHSVVFKDSPEHVLGGIQTFNLASTRVIKYRNGGRKEVFFKIERLAMDTTTVCSIWNAVFSVVYVP